MKNHFAHPINYDGRTVTIKVQCLSNELDKITYAVWPEDEELKKSLENVKQFYFHINSEANKNKDLTIRSFVVYDYKTPENKIKDVKFEFAVWHSLVNLNL